MLSDKRTLASWKNGKATEEMKVKLFQEIGNISKIRGKVIKYNIKIDGKRWK